MSQITERERTPPTPKRMSSPSGSPQSPREPRGDVQQQPPPSTTSRPAASRGTHRRQRSRTPPPETMTKPSRKAAVPLTPPAGPSIDRRRSTSAASQYRASSSSSARKATLSRSRSDRQLPSPSQPPFGRQPTSSSVHPALRSHHRERSTRSLTPDHAADPAADHDRSSHRRHHAPDSRERRGTVSSGTHRHSSTSSPLSPSVTAPSPRASPSHRRPSAVAGSSSSTHYHRHAEDASGQRREDYGPRHSASSVRRRDSTITTLTARRSSSHSASRDRSGSARSPLERSPSRARTPRSVSRGSLVAPPHSPRSRSGSPVHSGATAVRSPRDDRYLPRSPSHHHHHHSRSHYDSYGSGGGHHNPASPGRPRHSPSTHSYVHVHPPATPHATAAHEHLAVLQERKERELIDLHNYRVASLEQALEDKESQLRAAKKKLEKVSNDFVYNLKLIEDRDAELEKYESSFAKYVNLISEKDKEISELKVAHADVQSLLKQAEANLAESDVRYHSKLQQFRDQLDQHRLERDSTLRRLKEEYGHAEREWKRVLTERDNELDTVKRELAVEYEGALAVAQDEFSEKESKYLDEIAALSARVKALQLEAAHARAVEEEHKAMAAQARDQRDAERKARQQAENQLTELDQQHKAELQRRDTEQAGAAQRHKFAVSQLHQQLNDTKEQVSTLERRLETQAKEHARALKKQEDAQAAAVKEIERGAQQRAAALRQQLEASREELKAVRAELAQAERTIAQSKEKEKTIERTLLEETSQSRHEQEAQVRALKSELWTHQRQHAHTLQKVASLEKLLDQRRQDLVQAKQDVDQAEQKAARQARSLVDLKFSYEAKLQEQAQLMQETKDNLDLVVSQRDRARDELTQCERALGQCRKEHQAVSLQLQQLSAHVDPQGGQVGLRGLPVLQTTTSPARVRQSFSPTFAGDMGPASPLGSMPTSPRPGDRLSRSMHSSQERGGRRGQPVDRSGRGGGADVARSAEMVQYTQQLESQNKALRDVVGQMRQELEALHEAAADSKKRTSQAPVSDVPVSSNPAEETVVSVLRFQLAKLRQYNKVLVARVAQATVDPVSAETREVEFLRECVNELNQVVDKLTEDLSRANKQLEDAGVDDSQQVRELQDVIASQTEELKKCQSELREAHNHLSRMVSERERLMQISNMLKADMTRLLSSRANVKLAAHPTQPQYVDVGATVTPVHSAVYQPPTLPSPPQRPSWYQPSPGQPHTAAASRSLPADPPQRDVDGGGVPYDSAQYGARHAQQGAHNTEAPTAAAMQASRAVRSYPTQIQAPPADNPSESTAPPNVTDAPSRSQAQARSAAGAADQEEHGGADANARHPPPSDVGTNRPVSRSNPWRDEQAVASSRASATPSREHSQLGDVSGVASEPALGVAGAKAPIAKRPGRRAATTKKKRTGRLPGRKKGRLIRNYAAPDSAPVAVGTDLRESRRKR